MEPTNQTVAVKQAGPLNVLLIGSDPMDEILIRKRLGEIAENFQIRHVRDGLEAFDYLRSQDPSEEHPLPDLIVLDEELPNINGHQVLKELQSHVVLKAIPIVMVLKNKVDHRTRISYVLVVNKVLATTRETPLSPFLFVLQNYFKNK